MDGGKEFPHQLVGFDESSGVTSGFTDEQELQIRLLKRIEAIREYVEQSEKLVLTRIGHGYAFFDKIRNGKASFSEIDLERIAHLFEVPIDFLLQDGIPEPSEIEEVLPE